MTTASRQQLGLVRAPRVHRTIAPRGRPLRIDDATTLYAVALTPYGTARHLSKLWEGLSDDVQVVYKSLARLRRNGHVQAVEFRDQHINSNTSLKVHHVTPQGVRALEHAFSMERDALYRGTAPLPAPMLSIQWQRHLARHLDTVARAYDYACAIRRITGRTPNLYFPKQGSLDAWIWQNFAEGLSLGLLRVGPTLELSRLRARIRDLQRGGDELTSRHRERGGRRGPGLVLISVPTELDKWLIGGWFAPGGRFAGKGLQGLVATEEDASHGIWYNPVNNAWLGIREIAEFKPGPSTYDPVQPEYEVARVKMPASLPEPLYPVQSRILNCLFRYPLMRPTEIAATVGVAYNGRFNEHLAALTAAGLVKDIRELAQAQLVTYDVSEYRDRPQLLTDEGLKYLGARDRAKTGRYVREEVEKGKKRKRKYQTGILDHWGTEGETKAGVRFLGGDIRKMCRELHHTLGVNAAVARICRDLSYTPETLPDHCNRRYYKTSNWMGEDGEERRVTSSVAPDAAIVLRDGDRRRTIMLEVERSAAEGGGKSLTRKLTVWAEYAKQGGGRYLGKHHHEVVAFIVPKDSARDKLIRRLQLLSKRYGPMVQTVVITEWDFTHADNVMTDRIWTLATDPELPKVAINLS